MLESRTAWALARLVAGRPANGVDIAELPEDWREVASAIDTKRNGRESVSVLIKELEERFPQQATEILREILAVDITKSAPSLLPFTVTSADTILGEKYPDPVCAIPDLLPVGLATLGGRPKVGKSWLALQIAQAAGAGGYVLGRKVERASVLYFALEDSERRIQKRMRAQNWPRGLCVDFLHIGDMRQVGMIHEGGADKIRQAIRAHGYKLVIIDTLSRAMRGIDPKKAHLVAAALESLHEAAQDANAVILLIDHLRKTGSRDPDIIEDLIDSTVKAATVDTVWGLYRERGKKGAKLQVTGKDIDELTLALEFDPLTKAWQSNGDANALLTPVQSELMEIVCQHGKVKGSQIAAESGRDPSNVRKELAELVNRGLLGFDAATKEYRPGKRTEA